MGIYMAKRDRVLTVQYESDEGTFEVDFKAMNKLDPGLDSTDQTLLEFSILAIRGLVYEKPDGDQISEDAPDELKRWVCGDVELAARIQKGYYDFLSLSSPFKTSKRSR